MASIDKIYGTKKQFNEFYSWCKNNRPSALKYMCTKTWANSFVSKERFNIANFPTTTDRWLANNCPIKWVVRRIKEQYGTHFKDLIE